MTITNVMPEQVQTPPLFGPNDFDRLMDGDPTRARPTDPLTSHLAARALTIEDFQESQLFVLRTLITFGKSPAWRIEREAFGEWSPSRVRTALVELIERKLVTRTTATGRNAHGTRVVDEFEAVR